MIMTRYCVSTDKSKAELFIVRQSRVADAIMALRDPFTQAVLPLGSKMIEIDGAPLDEVLDDENVLSIIATIGVGMDLCEGESEVPLLDLSYLPYGKIILAVDGSSEGRHIQTQVLAFMQKYMRPIMKTGHVYVAATPPSAEMTEDEMCSQLMNFETRKLVPLSFTPSPV